MNTRTAYTQVIDLLKGVDDEFHQFFLDELEYTPDEVLNKPYTDNARDLLTTLSRCSKHHVDDDNRTIKHFSEHWIVVYKSGKVLFPENTFEFTSGFVADKNGKLIESYDNTPMQVTRSMTTAYRITVGDYRHNDGTLHGISIKKYIRNLKKRVVRKKTSESRNTSDKSKDVLIIS